MNFKSKRFWLVFVTMTIICQAILTTVLSIEQGLPFYLVLMVSIGIGFVLTPYLMKW